MKRGARLSTGPKQRGRFGRRSTSSETQPLGLIVEDLNAAGSSSDQWGQAWKEAVGILSALLPAPDTSDPKGRVDPIGPIGRGSGISLLRRRRPPEPWAKREKLRAYGSAIRSFNRMASGAGLALRLQGRRPDPSGPVTLELDAETPDARSRVAWVLWRFVFWGDRWRQLRRCEQCETWFVDHSDNQRRRFCNASCAAKWWTKGRRRAALQAGHVRRRGPRKGRGR